MKETTQAAMPPCFEKWCQKFDDCLKTKAQKKGFRNYLGGLLGESERKNLTQMADNVIEVVYHQLHHFLTEAPWDAAKINERRLQIMNQCSQTKIRRGFSLILDDSGHRKSGNKTDAVSRQYLGQIGKVDNGIVTVTTHLYDGKKSLPLDLELYQPASALPEGKKDSSFKKKPDLGIELIDRCLNRGYRPGIVLIDAGYGNNTTFLKELEKRKLNYLGGVAKNRQVIINNNSGKFTKIRLDELAKNIAPAAFKPVKLPTEKNRTVWVATFKARVSGLEEERTFAIVMNASSIEEATDINYLITNVDEKTATEEWVANTYSQRNWVEVFYREVKGWLGFTEYQVRDKRSMERHFILVFCAYTFIIRNKLTGGLQRQWAHKSLNTFTEALEAFRTATSFRFFSWMRDNMDVFASYKASLGFIWH